MLVDFLLIARMERLTEDRFNDLAQFGMRVLLSDKDKEINNKHQNPKRAAFHAEFHQIHRHLDSRKKKFKRTLNLEVVFIVPTQTCPLSHFSDFDGPLGDCDSQYSDCFGDPDFCV